MRSLLRNAGIAVVFAIGCGGGPGSDQSGGRGGDPTIVGAGGGAGHPMTGGTGEGGRSAAGGSGGSGTTASGGAVGPAGAGGKGGAVGTGGAAGMSAGRGGMGGGAAGNVGGRGGGASGGAAGRGAAETGGMSGGMSGSGGATASGKCAKPVASTSTRPQLTDAQAASYTIASYLAQTGPQGSPTADAWDPTGGLGSAASFTADFTVAADGSGTHTTVQAALSAATGSARRYILVKPGTYREQVSYTGSTPVTLYGASTDATQVVIVHNESAAQGTSQTLNVKANGFQLMNLTLSNDFATPASGSNIQALALLTNGDKIVLQNVRLHGFQDTVQFAAPSATTLARVYVKDAYIEGDTDYIYGNARVVLDGTTIQYLSSRRGTSAGVIFAPSTSVDNPLGFLAVHCTFTADAGAPTNTTHLGRSWDTSSTTPTPNGQAVIRESVIGAHVNKAAPWTAAATSGRAYTASGNRFYEYCNTGPGAGP